MLWVGGHPLGVPTTPQFIRRREAQCASEKPQNNYIFFDFTNSIALQLSAGNVLNETFLLNLMPEVVCPIRKKLWIGEQLQLPC